MVKKLCLIVVFLFAATGAFAVTEFDANSDGVFDDTFKFKVDNLVTSNSSSATVAANVLSILKAADYSAIRTLLSLRPGTEVQAYNANLANLAAITPVQGDIFYFNGTAIVALGYGTDGYVLKTQGVGKNPAWTAQTGSIATDTIFDALGDLVVGSGANTAARMAKGGEGTLLRYNATTVAATTSTFADTYAAGSLLGAASANVVAAVTTFSLGDDAAQLYDTVDDTKKILIEAGGLPTSTTAQMSPIEYIHVTVVKPQDMADAVRDKFIFWSNDSGKSFIVTGWKGWAGADDTTLAIKEYDADGASNVATVDAVELATGSGPYTGSDTTISAATIENGHVLALDFDDTDDPSFVKMTIYGYFAN